MPAATRIRTLRTTAALLAAVALVLVGCNDDDAGDGTTTTRSTIDRTTTSTPTSTTTTTSSTLVYEIDAADPNADVLEAHKAYWSAVLAAGAIPDEHYPDLAETAQGQALIDVMQTISANRELGRQSLSVLDFRRLDVRDRTDTSATVAYCGVDSGKLVDARTGERLDDGSVSVHAGQFALVLVGGVWKVDHSLEADTSICEGVSP